MGMTGSSQHSRAGFAGVLHARIAGGNAGNLDAIVEAVLTRGHQRIACGQALVDQRAPAECLAYGDPGESAQYHQAARRRHRDRSGPAAPRSAALWGNPPCSKAGPSPLTFLPLPSKAPTSPLGARPRSGRATRVGRRPFGTRVHELPNLRRTDFMIWRNATHHR
jgi:hypothetical protein